jgi:hypothetical protein
MYNSPHEVRTTKTMKTTTEKYKSGGDVDGPPDERREERHFFLRLSGL